MKRISEMTKDQIRGMLKTGATGYDIAYATGVSQATISKIRKDMEREGFDIWHRGGVVASSIY